MLTSNLKMFSVLIVGKKNDRYNNSNFKQHPLSKMKKDKHIIWSCPNCKYLITDLVYKLAKFDKCPCCQRSKLSQFFISKKHGYYNRKT